MKKMFGRGRRGGYIQHCEETIVQEQRTMNQDIDPCADCCI